MRLHPSTTCRIQAPAFEFQVLKEQHLLVRKNTIHKDKKQKPFGGLFSRLSNKKTNTIQDYKIYGEEKYYKPILEKYNKLD